MNPIVIIGGGVAGLGAAWKLRKHHHPFLVLESSSMLGGRLSTLVGDGWMADVGCPCFRQQDTALQHIIRDIGLETDVVVVQGPVRKGKMTNTGLELGPADFTAHRVTLRHGMTSLFEEWMRQVDVLDNKPVAGIRWQPNHHRFVFRDRITGRTLRHPESHEIIEASAVILAVPGPEARRIVESSVALEPLAPYLSEIVYEPSLVGVFHLPKCTPNYYAIEFTEKDELAWLAFEEVKAPSFVDPDSSLLVVRAGRVWAKERAKQEDDDCLDGLYNLARKVVPDMPDEPAEAHLVRWSQGRPSANSLVSIGDGGVPTNPPEIPFALAGDYTLGDGAESAALSGMRAADQVVARLMAAR